MNKWDELRKECYGKDTLERYQNGRIDFSPDSMRDVENGDFKSYDEYLEVQKRSCDKVRQFFVSRFAQNVTELRAKRN